MSARVNIDGRIVGAEEARIPVFDHGFLFGDAVYEVLRTHGGLPFLLPRHYQRLQRSADALALEIPWDLDRMRAEIVRTLEAGGGGEWMIRVIVTRGVGDMSPDPESCSAPSVIVLADPLDELPAELYREGIAIVISNMRRDPHIGSLKTGSLIHQVLGIREAKAMGASETIMLTAEGNLSDGTRTNIYLVQNGKILTPSVESGIVRGITRSIVLDVASECGIPVDEGRFGPGLAETADEVFVTSTTRGLLPVTRVNRHTVGDGKVGPVTRRLGEAYRERVQRMVADGNMD